MPTDFSPNTAPNPKGASDLPRWHWIRFLVRWVGGGVLLAWGLLFAAWLTLQWAILPRIEEMRPRIEQEASKALGVPVRIGRMQVMADGWLPAFELRDVQLLDAQQRPALVLPRIFAAPSLSSVWRLQLQFEQLSIIAPELDIRRDVQGRLLVAGIDFSRPQGDSTAALDWLFSQEEFLIQGGTLRWTDERRGAPPLVLSKVDLVLRNRLRHHTMRLDATPDPEWGERFTLRGDFTHPLLSRQPGDPGQWSGTAFAHLPRVDVQQLGRYATLPFDLQQGRGALRVWLDVRDGEAAGATADVALQRVSARLGDKLQPLVLEQVQGRVSGQRSANSFRFAASGLEFRTGDGVAWPASDFTLNWHQREGGIPDRGDVSADRLDLGILAQIAGRLPLNEPVRRLLADLAPQGVMHRLQASWEGPLDEPRRYRVQSQIRGLSIAAHPDRNPGDLGRPGLHNATVEIQASEGGGRASLVVEAGAAEFPGVFDEPRIALDRLTGDIHWLIRPARVRGSAEPSLPPTIEVNVVRAQFANADAQGELSARWRSGTGAGVGRGKRFPGTLDLNGTLSRADGSRTWRYLPRTIPEHVRTYVREAASQGRSNAVSFKVKGDLWDFPYADPKLGEFRIAARLEDTTFAYVPAGAGQTSQTPQTPQTLKTLPWPALTAVRGELIFDRLSMEIRDAEAQMYGVQLSQIQAGIKNLSDQATLTVSGQGRGPLTDLLRYVQATPIADWTRQSLAKTTGSGAAELRLQLNIPLHALDKTGVNGTVILSGNDVQILPDTPVLGRARGIIEFSDQGFSIRNASARVLGGDARFEGGTRADGALSFRGQGIASADGLRKARELGPWARVGQRAGGQTAYTVGLNVIRGVPELSVASNLVGLRLDLPPPLNKRAESELAVRLQTRLLQSAAEAGDAHNANNASDTPVRDRLTLNIGDAIAAQYVRDRSGPEPKVLSGGIGIYEPAPTPDEGVVAHLSAQRLDLDAWRTLATELGLMGERAADAPAGAGAAEPPVSPYVPGFVALSARELVVAGHSFTDLVVGASREGALWRANLDAGQLNGYAEFRPTGVPGGGGRLYARLSRLSIPQSSASQVESLLHEQTSTLPAIDLEVENFELRGIKFGRLEIEAFNRFGHDAREWRLTKLRMTVPEAQFSATGSWAAVRTAPGTAVAARTGPAPLRRTTLDFKLNLSDSGAFLERLGLGEVIRGGKGKVEGQIGWLGSPFALDDPSLSGQFNIALDAGQFLKVEPGIAKLLGVLNLQALPRRLVLDFRDVFFQGFAFDNITGDVKVTLGVAATNNLRMRGVQAAVLMEGSADIAKETQDLTVVVVPEINAGTASLAFSVINPAVGIGTFLAQAFLRRPLIRANTREYKVTGTWADPKVEQVSRPLPQAVSNASDTPDETAPSQPGGPSGGQPEGQSSQTSQTSRDPQGPQGPQELRP